MPRLGLVVDIRRLAVRLGRFRRLLLLGIQTPIFLAAGVIAFLLRFDFVIPPIEWVHLYFGLCAWGLAKVLVFHMLGLDRGWWRYVSVPDLVRLLAANALSSTLAAIGLIVFAPPGFPRSIYVLDLLLCSIITAGGRRVAGGASLRGGAAAG